MELTANVRPLMVDCESHLPEWEQFKPQSRVGAFIRLAVTSHSANFHFPVNLIPFSCSTSFHTTIRRLIRLPSTDIVPRLARLAPVCGKPEYEASIDDEKLEKGMICWPLLDDEAPAGINSHG